MDISRRDFIKKSIFFGVSFLIPGAFSCTNQEKSVSASKAKTLVPSYLMLEKQGTLAKRIERLYSIFESCELCPRECHVNRLEGEKGFCGATAKLMVASAHPHFGEESPLVGRYGSGTIFFSHCGLRCVFCQNYTISHLGQGEEITEVDLARIMVSLQERGCHNINLVTPTHYVPNIAKALQLAIKQGLQIPLVYNTSGYERIEILRLLDGIIDIYLPDLKYMDGRSAEKYSSNAFDYPEYATRAIIEMHRQVGELITDRNGIALRGLIIRHLIMPNNVAGTERFIKWVAENLPKSTYVNIMGQYRPEFKAFDYPEIARRITEDKYIQAIHWAKKYGLTRLD